MSLRFNRPQQQPVNDPCPDRRRFLRFGVAATTSLLVPRAFANVLTKLPAQRERQLSLLNLHTGERLNATYWVDGQYQTSELEAINHILRDHRTGDVTRMDKKLLDLLNELHQQMDSKQAFQIISGYRSPKTNAALRQKSSGVARKSLHMQGKAIDIRLPDCALSDLRKAAISCQTGGVGYYQKSNFIHIDTGRIRYWG